MERQAGKTDSDAGTDKNPHIPKYIVSKPWYREQEGDDENDYLAHQRKEDGVIQDHSLPTAGKGIEDTFASGTNVRDSADVSAYDTKRDRWYGYDNEEWINMVKKWDDLNKSQKQPKKTQQLAADADVDDDDTDYELELIELGLQPKDIRSNVKEDPLEKMLRDREDISSYILNITAKEKIEYDPKSRLSKDLAKGFLNDSNQFVKKLSGESVRLQDLQRFAWEKDSEDRQTKESNLTESQIIDDERKRKAMETDINLNLEANPTLMELKLKQQENAIKQRNNLKRQKLTEKYGSTDKTAVDE